MQRILIGGVEFVWLKCNACESELSKGVWEHVLPRKLIISDAL